MDPRTFDTLTKRLSRRTLTAGSLGVGAALLGHRPSTTHAQDGTPIPAATPPAEATVEVLYVQSFAAGTLTPHAETADALTLTLEGGTGQTAFFSERPERLIGTLTTATFLDGRAFDPADPPNAAISALTEGGEVLLLVELREPGIEADTGVVTYHAQLLPEAPEGRLGSLEPYVAPDLPDGEVGAVTLFIDGLACTPSGGGCQSDADCCSDYCCIDEEICPAWTCIGTEG
jgi:hypothetical protein